jgi:hypothetical protein
METYVVRIWKSNLADAPRDEIRGFVERVGEGEERSFVGVEELVAHLTRGAVTAAQGRPAR